MIFWIFFLILSLIVEVYLWWKLQASLIFLSGRTCTIGGWLNTFLPHCVYIYIYICICILYINSFYEVLFVFIILLFVLGFFSHLKLLLFLSVYLAFDLLVSFLLFCFLLWWDVTYTPLSCPAFLQSAFLASHHSQHPLLKAAHLKLCFDWEENSVLPWPFVISSSVLPSWLKQMKVISVRQIC